MVKERTVIGLCIVIVVAVAIIVGCNASNDDDGKDNMMGTVIGEKVIELPVIEEIDFESALKYFEENYGKYGAKYGCTVVGKQLSEEDGGDMIVGRSYDLSFSYAPGYIVRTAVPGLYKTIGITNNAIGGASFDDVSKNGLTEKELWTVYCMTGDVLNEKGLYIEANMRPGQPESTGIKESNGTNPGADVRLCFATLARYLGERTATVDEAVALAQTLDVYGLNNGTLNWGGAIFLADASGHYGVLELVDNKLIWLDMQQAQANFYLNPEYKDKAVYGAGLGRYDKVMSGIDDVHSEADMLELIRQVRCQYTCDVLSCPFDAVSEDVGEEIDGKVYTLQDLDDPEVREIIIKHKIEFGNAGKKASFDELVASGTWLSAYQTVTNCNDLTILVQFFEDNRLIYRVSFEGW